MKATTGFDLIAVDITPEEKAALSALLYSGITGGALERLALTGLQKRLSACYNGHWEIDHNKDAQPSLADYGIAERVSPDSSQLTSNSIK